MVDKTAKVTNKASIINAIQLIALLLILHRTNLSQVHLEQSDLRKKDVLSAMSQLLEQELSLIQNYQDERSETSKVLLENETKTNLLLNDVFQEYDRSRMDLVEKVNQNEDWQKSAVAALIAKNDARSWGLMEQIKIVESQIAAMTNLELDKKKANQDELLNDVADKRVNLTFVLLDLMEQQDKRKRQLRETLLDMENQKTEDDFWLMQYQKLLDSRGVMQSMQASLDPVLGYNFLLNGVVHVVPFLLKIWQKKDFQLELVSDDDLQNAGIKNPKDRQGVLKAISDFLATNFNSRDGAKTIDDAPGPSEKPTAPQEDSKLSPTSSASSREHPADAVNAVECVVCMDAQTRVIFLPCGEFQLEKIKKFIFFLIAIPFQVIYVAASIAQWILLTARCAEHLSTGRSASFSLKLQPHQKRHSLLKIKFIFRQSRRWGVLGSFVALTKVLN